MVREPDEPAHTLLETVVFGPGGERVPLLVPDGGVVVRSSLDGGTVPRLRDGALVAGRYLVEGLLGRGGFSEVYRVLDQRDDGRPLALKLHRVADRIGFALESLKAEFALLATLSHPNLAVVHDFGWVGDDIAFFTQSIATGVRFDQTGVPLGSERGVRLVAQLASALDYLHTRGILHRDVKPANVLVDLASDQLTLLDFGVSRAFGAVESGLVIGTHAYLSPEAIRGDPLDARADLYALGVMLYKVAAGALPFRGSELLAKHVYELPPPLPQDTLSAGANAVIVRLLAKNPSERYASAGEACVALAAALGIAVQIESGHSLAGYVLSARYVGPASEIDALATRALSNEANRRPIVIVGEEGTGKSRLLREVRQRVQLAGRAWIGVRATQDDAGAALVTDIARAVLTKELVGALPHEERLELVRAVPELRRRGERLDPVVDPDRSRLLGLEALARTIALCFARRPGVLAIEGLDFASEDALRGVQIVVDRLAHSGASTLVLATGRPSGAMSRLGRVVPHHVLRTSLLTPRLSLRLVESMFGRPGLLAGTALGHALARRRHSALFVQESLRLALDTGAIVRRGGQWVVARDIPALALDDVLAARIRRLPPRARRHALALAVLGGPSTLADITRVAGPKAVVDLEALRELVRGGLVEVRQDTRRHASYTMPARFEALVRAAATSSALRAAHRRAARLLLGRERAGHHALVRAAQHLRHAGDVRGEVETTRRAAASADAAGRPDVAYDLMTSALDRGATLRVSDTGRLAALLLRHDYAQRAGLSERMRAGLPALARARASATPLERVAIAMRLARVAAQAGDSAVARRRCRAALEEARAVGAVAEECALWLLAAELEADSGSLARSIDEFVGAARLSEARNEASTATRAWLGASLAALHLGRTELGFETARGALHASRASRDLVLRSDARRQLGNARRGRGELRAALREYRGAVRDARASGSLEAESKALNNIGTVGQELGLVEEALVSYRRAIHLKERTAAPGTLAITRNNLACLLLAIGDHAGAASELDRGLAIDERSAPRVAANLRTTLGDLHVLGGRADAAVVEYRRALALSEERGNAPQQVHTLSGLVRALCMQGGAVSLREAAERFADLTALCQTHEQPNLRRRLLLTAAVYYDATVQPEQMLRAALDARRESVTLQFVDALCTPIESRYLLALALARAGRATAAARALDAAARLLVRHCARVGERAARYRTAHPLHRAIESRSLDVPSGWAWPRT